MHNNESASTYPIDFEQTTQVLSPYDPQFEYMIVRPRLSAKFAEVRQPRPVPTSALIDGSARARRDCRAAARGVVLPTPAERRCTLQPATASRIRASSPAPFRPGVYPPLHAA